MSEISYEERLKGPAEAYSYAWDRCMEGLSRTDVARGFEGTSLLEDAMEGYDDAESVK